MGNAGHPGKPEFDLLEPNYKRLHKLIMNPFHVLQENFLTTTIITLCRSTVGVAGNAMSSLDAVIFEKIHDAGRTERVRRLVSR